MVVNRIVYVIIVAFSIYIIEVEIFVNNGGWL